MLDDEDFEEDEDIHENPFFLLVRKNFENFYLEAGRRGGSLLCIPARASLSGATLSSDFVAMHILFPSDRADSSSSSSSSSSGGSSRYYVTLSGRLVELRGGRVLVRRSSGFREDRSIEVLSSEDLYDRRFPRSVLPALVVAAPFEGGRLEELPPVPLGRRVEDAERYLSSFPENALVLAKFATDASEAVRRGAVDAPLARRLCGEALEALLCANATFRAFYRARRRLRGLSEIVEVWVLSRLHAGIWPGLCAAFSREDARCASVMRDALHLAPRDLGARAAVPVEAAAQLDGLSEARAPYSILDSVRRARDAARGAHAAAAADEEVPALVYMLVQSAPPHLYSLLQFCAEFTFGRAARSEWGYLLVTLEAVVAFVMAGMKKGTKTTTKTKTTARRPPMTGIAEGAPRIIALGARGASLEGLAALGRSVEALGGQRAGERGLLEEEEEDEEAKKFKNYLSILEDEDNVWG